MQLLTPEAISQRLRGSPSPAAWSGCVQQAPPLAPQPRTLYCAWLRDTHGTAAVASTRPFALPAADRAAFARCAAELGVALVDPHACLQLLPVYIPKPWGAEVWYSGIERRGESRLSDGRFELPLGHACALFPERFGGAAGGGAGGGAAGGGAPRLLKRLCPHHEPIIGDLYFEVHARKCETYVVSHVDRRAWPDGVGEVRFGLADGTSPARLRAALHVLQAARAAADASLEGLPADLTADAWCAARKRLPAHLLAAETRARAQVDTLVGRRALRAGDVLTVPPGVPHGLRHGVEVVELQTPDYERHILYASQPVVTQAGWDIDTGVTLLARPPGTPAGIPTPERHTLAAGACLHPPADRAQMCLVISGQLQGGSVTLTAGQACLVPAGGLRAGAASVCVLVDLAA